MIKHKADMNLDEVDRVCGEIMQLLRKSTSPTTGIFSLSVALLGLLAALQGEQDAVVAPEEAQELIAHIQKRNLAKQRRRSKKNALTRATL